MWACENTNSKCPKCGEKIEAPESMQGEFLDCPYCHCAAEVPDLESDFDAHALLKGPPVDILSSSASMTGVFETLADSSLPDIVCTDVIRFRCKCGQILKAPIEYIGKKARCQRCNHRTLVPEKSTC